MQTLEKKISILEKAVELNPENEELLLSLLNAYQKRDSGDVLIERWVKILMHHSGSYKLWIEFLHVCQADFSRFKVSDIRKTYAHAIQAVSSACNKLCRQVFFLPLMNMFSLLDKTLVFYFQIFFGLFGRLISTGRQADVNALFAYLLTYFILSFLIFFQHFFKQSSS